MAVACAAPSDGGSLAAHCWLHLVDRVACQEGLAALCFSGRLASSAKLVDDNEETILLTFTAICTGARRLSSAVTTGCAWSPSAGAESVPSAWRMWKADNFIRDRGGQQLSQPIARLLSHLLRPGHALAFCIQWSRVSSLALV